MRHVVGPVVVAVVLSVGGGGCRRGASWVDVGMDASKELTLSGTIKEFGRASAWVGAAGDAGEDVDRRVAPPSRMENRGLKREMLAPGTRLPGR